MTIVQDEGFDALGRRLEVGDWVRNGEGWLCRIVSRLDRLFIVETFLRRRGFDPFRSYFAKELVRAGTGYASTGTRVEYTDADGNSLVVGDWIWVGDNLHRITRLYLSHDAVPMFECRSLCGVVSFHEKCSVVRGRVGRLFTTSRR